ncbi:16S rRNA (guanine(527)-N(7))-methyltransferase RsmG [Fructobacillus sp. M158]|uniref:16S rRNA (guanine(527)-N(7))-methyltransferase RsmG n=1 Tax=Fructobacillus parabroussonetiae TaxID=2713174 RepID=UPI00200B7B61|nr:16S rRNA (guanine(527)-N(7))-methyltransferase RsmG [Fructobacillus parabroussonetiae]MCK8617780.1 16S rRNA (guanine(527)-N(7))-methyltransferase RsmG [Fructobacillus parabroussonetiae]
MDQKTFEKTLEEAGLPLSKTQLAQFETYFNELVLANQSFNLTAITEKEEVYLKHFFDSLTLAMEVPALREGEPTLIDVGSGAGFPALPLKIALPNLQVTMVDSLNKRVNFLKQMVERLGLEGVTVRHGRAEDLGKESALRESFDFATARAVARTQVLAEYTLPFVRIGGQFLVMKGSAGQEEMAAGQKALSTLGGKMVAERSFTLPNGDPRVIQIVDKVAKTPKKYPRQAGTPTKKPL